MPDTSARVALRQIKASAGSGKTYTLTGDFLRLLAGSGEAAPSGCHMPRPGAHSWPEIMAITFTNRAASEMRERVLARLKDMALGAASQASALEEGWDATRADRAVNDLLRDFGSLNIRTIDSLLHLIVRLAALDLNLPPNFEACFDNRELFAPLLDDLAERAREGDPELTEAFARACRQILQHDEHPGFLAGDRIRDGITNLASFLLGGKDDPRLLQLASPETIAAHLGSLRADLRECARELLNALDSAGLNVKSTLLNALDTCTTCADKELPPDSVMLTKSCLDECLNKESKGQASPDCERLYTRLSRAAARLKGDGEILRRALGLMPFYRLARRMVDELNAFQRDAGLAAAALVPALASGVLGGQYGVNEAFCRMGSRLTHILVDEFQDTSMEQWKALKPLVEEALSRGGSLTIVGDVKQAIYGWRGGEATLFDRIPTESSLLNIVPKPEILRLDHNWRSHEVVVNWNNAVFSQLAETSRAKDILTQMLPAGTDSALLDEDAAILSTTFADASQRATPGKGGGMVCLHTLPADCKDDDEKGVAALLADRVADLGKRHAWSDICILTRTNDQTSLAASLLLKRGIPVVTQGSLLLAEQPLIIQLVELLAFLNAPEDDKAFWTVLAGADLLPAPSTLPVPGGPVPAALDAATLNDWAARRKEKEPRTGRRRRSLASAFRADFPLHWELLFAPLHDAAGLLTPYDTVCEIFRRWRVPSRHPRARGFLLRFLEVLHRAEELGLSDLAGFLDYWKEHGGEEKAPLPETMNAVSIMTIHKAKGLQFEAVVVPWHNFRIKAGSKPVIREADGLTVLSPPCPAMGEDYSRALLEAAREALHLLYVAWTRAVSELHCFFPEKGKKPMTKALTRLLAPLLEDAPRTEDGDLVFGGPSESDSTPESAARPTPGSGLRLPEHAVWQDTRQDLWHDDAAPEQLPAGTEEEQPEAWRPMAWLPRLKIFRSPLEDWLDDDGPRTAKRRGTLMHHCLEHLRITGTTEQSAREDAAQAVRHGLRTFPLPVQDAEAAARDLTEALAWYAALPETGRHLAFGTPERTLLDAEGRARRVDLLVDDGDELVAVEYKTGTAGDLPNPDHTAQLRGYMELLRAASGRPARGELVYLDRRERFFLDETGDGPAKAAS